MSLNASSIKKRLTKLEQYISELKKQQKIPPAELRQDFTRQLAVERAFQAGIECCADIASHLVSVFSLGKPSEQRDLFLFLANAGYMSDDFAKTMGEMAALRNRIVHMYWDIDLTRLYQYLQEDVKHLERFRDITIAILEAEE